VPNPWEITRGDGPIIATAIHAGHDTRPEVEALLAVDEETRLREEDPHTDSWITIGDTQIRVHQSRFEFDLNRPRDKAVYLSPDDAWGIDLWTEEPPATLVETSRSFWDAYYGEMEALCDELVEHHGHFVVLDLHSYNHRRNGPDAPVEDPELNPEINVGTESITEPKWNSLVQGFISDLHDLPFDGGHLDVRTNVRFKGGHFPSWVNSRYGDKGCALAIEVKKFFMNEWTSQTDEAIIGAIGEALEATIRGIREQLDALA
jgi:N-formylglutamate deformylase